MNDMNETTLNAACVRAAEGLVRLATERDVRVSTAESCTAGMVSSYIAGVPGASAVLLGGAVTYCDDIKNHVLDVPAKTLENHTAVSGETASAMADGSRKLFGSDVAVGMRAVAEVVPSIRSEPSILEWRPSEALGMSAICSRVIACPFDCKPRLARLSCSPMPSSMMGLPRNWRTGLP